ncbi:MAG TPA: cellulose synthase operon protein YhjQ/BcsQ [Edaphobacter sp.]|uniref:cellulose synthase operon protein YhjQ/BcsQ n=1 Tax=Edaphobacter sp. TaxID=1934404 RepID=UPI002CAA3CD4|nr:cellulose synthase operon protein YhjQ/BcsQ [Edaphobacter sp.]HUZ97505.1 cellulose synthase operon protein YhjQ/BcsQ [Edaphobacter sp.]
MMDSRDQDPNEALPATKTREDSSALYSWANLHGIKHRDFSARQRANLHDKEQQAAIPATAKPGYPGAPDAAGFRPSREADNAPRTEGVERRKGVRRAEAIARAETMTGHESREITDPVQRQAARDAEFDLRRRPPTVPIPTSAQFIADDDATEHGLETNPLNDAHPEADFVHEATASESLPPSSVLSGTADSAGPAWLYSPPTLQIPAKPLAAPSTSAPASVAETLQSSRERVASRWFALKGVFEQIEDPAEAASFRQKETRTPVLAVYSIAGGVGKTSLVATVGRSLSAMGEKVLLTDTTSHGLLPFYFGANELQHDTVRTFSPPSGSTDAPIYLVSHEMEEKGREESAQELFLEEVATNSQGMHRILLDLSSTSGWVIRQMARMNLTVLVPVAPDMNSVISTGFVERFFSGLIDNDARPLQPFYVLNQFDPSLPLHLDVREVLRRKLGDRLLPFVIHRAPAVSEALAEGMTVVDYAPDTPIAEDYIGIATWLRTIAAPASAGFRTGRWTER